MCLVDLIISKESVTGNIFNMFTKYKHIDLCRRSNNFAIDRLSRPQMKVQKKILLVHKHRPYIILNTSSLPSCWKSESAVAFLLLLRWDSWWRQKQMSKRWGLSSEWRCLLKSEVPSLRSATYLGTSHHWWVLDKCVVSLDLLDLRHNLLMSSKVVSQWSGFVFVFIKSPSYHLWGTIHQILNVLLQCTGGTRVKRKKYRNCSHKSTLHWNKKKLPSFQNMQP